MSDGANGPDTGARELMDALQRAVNASAYMYRDQTIGAGQMRSAYLNRRWGDQTWLYYAAAVLKTPDDSLAGLADALRPFLANYLEQATDRVGNGLYSLFGGSGRLKTPTVPEFGEVLVGGAVKLGPTRVVELLLGWTRGEPLHSRWCALLEGVAIEEPLGLQEGVRIVQLSPSLMDLPVSLPPFGVAETQFLGGVMLSIDCELAPSLFAPEELNDAAPFGRPGTNTAASNKIPNLSHDSFCESMSLACGEYVDWRRSWTDYGDLDAFSLSIGSGGRFKHSQGVRRTAFAQKDLERAREIHLVRHTDASGRKRNHLDQAISRWMKSKRSSADSDRLIELRIALGRRQVARGQVADRANAARPECFGPNGHPLARRADFP